MILKFLFVLFFAIPCHAASVGLSWNPATFNVDGSTMTDLAGYTIFESTNSAWLQSPGLSQADFNVVKISVSSETTTASVGSLDPGTTYFFGLSAFNTSGVQSSSFDTIVSTFIPPEALAVFSTTILYFPTTAIGSQSFAQNFTINNNGNAPLILAITSDSGDYAISNDCGGVVLPGAFCFIDATFAPTTVGVKHGSIFLGDNGSQDQHSLDLLGLAIYPTIKVPNNVSGLNAQ